MKIHGGSVVSPGITPTSYLLSPLQSSSSRSSLYPQSPSGSLSRSLSAHPTEREAAWLYDRPGTWRPRFQMPRSGENSLLPDINRRKSFPPGAFRHFPAPPQSFYYINFFLIYRRGKYIIDAHSGALTVDTTQQTLDDHICFSTFQEPLVIWDLPVITSSASCSASSNAPSRTTTLRGSRLSHLCLI